LLKINPVDISYLTAMALISSDIIILGAGPTGLMFANQLTRFGVDFIILDQKAGPTDQSRALVVHPRSMEIYQQLGLSAQVVADGQKNDGMNFYRNGKQVASVTLINNDERSSPFPFVMTYEQSKNEDLLYRNLLTNSRSVQWNTTINAIKKENEFYILTAKQLNDQVTYQCKYLIACDGSKSIARDFAGMEFTGGTYLNVFYVADTHVDAGFSSNKLSLFLTGKSITMLFPMKGPNHFRALGILPTAFYHQDDIPFEKILDTVKREMKMPVEFYDTNWHSTYRLHHKKVTHFNKENIFFAGDAAHVHSPAGGQGMNTGLQDAYNLAWKLALVQKGKATTELLATYHEERNPVATELLKTTDRLFSVMSSNGFWPNFFRFYFIPFIVPLITKFKFVRKKLFHMISQLDINYVSSSLSSGKENKIQAGLRLPYFLINQDSAYISIYDLINKNTTPFTILLYGVNPEGIDQLDKELFGSIKIDKNAENDAAIKEAGLPRSFMIMVRPDNYIGGISSDANFNGLAAFLKYAYFLQRPQ
jgi:2-polyprenyl-6-methoxyphenol hydroxylase-like FAD-dependent oxidoreductase